MSYKYKLRILDLSDASGWKNLAKGYERIKEFQEQIDQDWKDPTVEINPLLQESFQERHAAWEKHIAAPYQEYQKRIKTINQHKTWLWIGVGIGGFFYLNLMCFVLFFLSTNAPFSWLGFLFASGALGVGYAVTTHRHLKEEFQTTSVVELANFPKPELLQLDEHPKTDSIVLWLDQITKYFHEWTVANGQNPSEKYDHNGIEGEYNLLKNLNHWTAVSATEYLVLHSVLLDHNLDGDIIILAPQGVFLLECKHWRGKITHEDGNWQHIKESVQPNGYTKQEVLPIKDPAKQYHRERQALLKTLQTAKVLPDTNDEDWLRGGLVFTHSEARYYIYHPPCEWGTIDDWTKKIIEQRLETPLTLEQRLRIADALLSKAKELGDFPNIMKDANQTALTICDEIDQSDEEVPDLTMAEAEAYTAETERLIQQYKAYTLDE